jgi:endonuclease YncB( thermonuclease family)
VTCEQRDVDRYGRIVAVCRAGLNDLGAFMVANGWALAYRRYSTAYVGPEGSAKAARRGIWRGTFTAPWDWRRGDRTPYAGAVSE